MSFGIRTRYSGSMKPFYIYVATLLVLAVLAIVFIPRARAQDGRIVNDVPDELKLNPAQQKQVDDTPPPLSAIAVTCDGLAVALFIQLDADHLFRADPRQSDMFTAVNQRGLPPHTKTMVQTTAPPMEWKVAYAIAEKAILSSHVVVPCVTGDHT